MEVTKPGTPASGYLAGLHQHVKPDLQSGFLIFLMALPLCLAIAKASGFPPVAGIITAIIGGLVPPAVGGSGLTVKGPAAGLIVIAAGAVHELGRGNALLGYRLTLAAIVVAGVVQIILGLLRSAMLSDLVPPAAIHGMMTAIGVTILLQQIFVLTGTAPGAQPPLQLLAMLPAAVIHLNPAVFFIGAVSLALLAGTALIKAPGIRRIPVQLLVLVVAIALARSLGLSHEHIYSFLHHRYTLGPALLVKLPEHLTDAIAFPDFSRVFSAPSVKYIVMFALVGSLESLLSAQAVALLAPRKHRPDLNRDLLGVGLGNALAGLLGGLPMISEIVRSSANVAAGAQTRWANFFHGLFLLLFTLVGYRLLAQIPLAALGALLVHTGFRLASPRVVARLFRMGAEQLLVFGITVVVSLGSNLLLGIGAGMAVQLLVHLRRGLPVRSILRARLELLNLSDGGYLAKVYGALVFSNYPSLKSQLVALPEGKHLIIDLSDTQLVDHTVLENLQRLRVHYEQAGGQLELVGLQGHKPASTFPSAARVRAEAVSLASA